MPFSLLLALALLPATPQQPSSLAALRDRYRPLLIFAPTDAPQLTEQMHLLLSHRADLIDRQILLVPAFHKYAGGGDWEIITLMGSEEPALRNRFHIGPNDFTVVLIGKDGGEKFRSHQPINMDKLIELIDAMPMRRQESKSKVHQR